MLRHQLRPPEDRRIRRLDLLGPCWAPTGGRGPIYPLRVAGRGPLRNSFSQKRLEGKNITNNPRKINQKSIEKSIQNQPWRLLGSFLGLLGGILEAPWGSLGASWGPLGLLVSWSRPGRVLGASWRRLGGQHGSNLAPKTEPTSVKTRSQNQSIFECLLE